MPPLEKLIQSIDPFFAQHGAEFCIGSVTCGEVITVCFAQCLDVRVGPFAPDFTVSITLPIIETLRFVMLSHYRRALYHCGDWSFMSR
jgi:hypothetical protein